MSAREREGFVVMLGRHAGLRQIRSALLGTQIPQRRDTRERCPRDVGAPGGRRFVASGAHDETARGELREQRVAQPLIERLEQLVRVDEQHAGGGPLAGHARCVGPIDAQGLAQREEESGRRRIDVAAIDAHDGAAGFGRHARELLEQRGLPYSARSVDVQRDEGRFTREQRGAEDLKLRLATDETTAAR
jgi:hypothetical protein